MLRRIAVFGAALVLVAACEHRAGQPAAPCDRVARPVASSAPVPAAPAADAAVRLTRPRDAAAAFREELGYLEQLVDLWWAARERHVELDHVDVHAVFERAKTALGGCSELACYAEIVRSALCALGDGHLRLEPEWWLEQKRYESGLEFADSRDGLLVAHGSATLDAGDRVLRVGDAPVDAALRGLCQRPGSTPAQRRLNGIAALSRQSFFSGAPAPLRLTVRRANGEERSVSVEWKPEATDRSAARRACVEGRMLDASSGIGLLTVRSFWCGGDPRAFHRDAERARDALRAPKRLIVDLRENGGGEDEPARWLASVLIRKRIEWMRYRHHHPYRQTPAEFFRDYVDPNSEPAWSKWREAELWVAIGPGCFSTCETFASALRAPDVGRVGFVGENTAGGVGNPTLFRLPYSGLEVEIPVTLYAQPGVEGDVLIEGRGVAPDLDIAPTAEQVSKGEDAVLAATLDKISRKPAR